MSRIHSQPRRSVRILRTEELTLNVKLLIDAIVRQTTVLIAQLSTTAGIRAPLSHVADRVFVELVREIESQGVGRKVVADMFGMALRSYQKKIHRLTESVTTANRTLWEAVLEYLQSNERATRARLLQRFKYDGEKNVAAVLNDLVSSGLVYRTGRGASTVYGITSEDDYKRLLDEDQRDSLAALGWVHIYRGGGATKAELMTALGCDTDALDGALQALIDDGRVIEDTSEEPIFRAANMVVPVGSEFGWEGAVFDHFQAVVTAISAKLARAPGRSAREDVIGGATLSFDVYPGHPHEDEVYALLRTVRAQINEVWTRVSTENKANPVPEEQKTKVTFYFGQALSDAELEHSEEDDE